MMGPCRMILIFCLITSTSCSAGDERRAKFLAPPGPQIRPWPLSFGQAPGNPGPPGSSENQEESAGLAIMRPNRVLSVEASMPAQAHLSQPSNIFASIWAPWSTWGFCVDGRQIRVRACNTITGFRCYGTNMESRFCEASNMNTQSRSIFNNIFGTDGTEVTRTMVPRDESQLEFQHWTPEKVTRRKSTPVPNLAAPPRKPRPQLLAQPQLYPAQNVLQQGAGGGLSWPANSNNLQPFSYTENRAPSLLNAASAAPVVQTSYPANADSKLYSPPLNVANDAAWWSQWSEYSVCNCGTRSRTRTCDVTNVYLSNGCPGPSYQLLPCDDGGKCSGRKPLFLSCLDGGCGGGEARPAPRKGGCTGGSCGQTYGQAPNIQPPVVPSCYGPSCGKTGGFQPPTVQSCSNGNCGSASCPGGECGIQQPQLAPYGAGSYGYYKPYTAPPSGPALFNIWMDAVWQPTAQWKAVATTVAPFVDGYGNVIQPGSFQPESTPQFETSAGQTPQQTTILAPAAEDTSFATPTSPRADATTFYATTSSVPLAGKRRDATTRISSTTTEESEYEEEDESTTAAGGKSTLPPQPPPPKGWKGAKPAVQKQKLDKKSEKVQKTSTEGARASGPR